MGRFSNHVMKASYILPKSYKNQKKKNLIEQYHPSHNPHDNPDTNPNPNLYKNLNTNSNPNPYASLNSSPNPIINPYSSPSKILGAYYNWKSYGLTVFIPRITLGMSGTEFTPLRDKSRNHMTA